jgi:5-methyltetrahydrofolate--homocysteine methyltransferase
LFKGQWQFKQGRKSKEEYDAILNETVYPKFAEVKAKAIREKLLRLSWFTAIFPCQSSGNDLIIYQDDETTEQLDLPSRVSRWINAAGKIFVLPIILLRSNRDSSMLSHSTLVTMGRKASEHSAQLFKSDNYQDYLLFHGLSVESAEALAELWHKRIREELGIAGNDAPDLAKLFHQGYQGSRYSFGYPACPNISDQTKLFELLQPERIDVELTDEFMLDPEQSTSAIIVHHPEAKYFNIE